MSDLKHLLRTNRELIRVLDEQLAVLERVSFEFDETWSEKQTYLYLSTYTKGDTEARIQIDQDATYVAEKLFIIEKPDLYITLPNGDVTIGPSRLPPQRTFSLVDENSGRELTISAVGKQPVSSGAVPVFAVPFLTSGTAYDDGDFLKLSRLGSYTPYTGQTEYWLQFRDEFVLPRGSVLRIRSTTLDGEIPPEDFGFTVGLVGYKVFG